MQTGLKLYRVILPVNDIEAAEAFYSRLLGTPGKRVSPGRHYFDLGGTILACYDAAADGDDGGFRHNPEHIYISTPDLDSTFRTVVSLQSAVIDAAIETMAWGERSFYFTDPFGNRVCMVDERTKFTGA